MSVTSDDLRNMASEAVGRYLAGHGNLTESVVKVASGCKQTLTSEHVRRICEMAYHDAYERHYKMGSTKDRYVTFDPPEAELAIARLRVERINTKTASASSSSFPGFPSMDKNASAPMHPKKYVPINAFSDITKSAEAPKVNWENPLGDVYRIRQNVVEAIKEMEGRFASIDLSEKHAMFDLFGQAAAAVKQGHGVSDVLYACLGPDRDDLPPKIASSVLNDVTQHLGERGFKLEMGKSASAEVNPDHPLPQAFTKVAYYRRDRMQAELALADLRTDLREIDQQVSRELR